MSIRLECYKSCSYEILDKTIAMCNTLNSDILHMQTPTGLKFTDVVFINEKVKHLPEAIKAFLKES